MFAAIVAFVLAGCGNDAARAGAATAADAVGSAPDGKVLAGDVADEAAQGDTPATSDANALGDAAAADAAPEDALTLGDAESGPETRVAQTDVPAADAETADVQTSLDAAPDSAAAPDANGDATPQPADPLWDLAKVADPATAQCAFTGEHLAFEKLAAVQVWNASYVSWESNAGKLTPIVIKGFAARPANAVGKLPGVVLAHGLGGFASEDAAVELAARLGVVVLAYTGPGGGNAPNNTSEGAAAGSQKGYRMFDTLVDVRGSWFWGHATAAMRAVTCLAARPDVAPGKLGVTGFSAGGVVSLLVAGHDPRVAAAVPMSGTLAWDVATQAPKAWQHKLLAEAGLSVASPEWQKLMAQLIAPSVALAAAHAKVLMLNGTTDEFFPLTAHVATFDALPGTDRRTSLAGNFDHGCYSVSGGEPKAIIELRAKLRAEGGQKMWFGKWFGTDPQFAYVPQPPQVTIQPMGAATLVTAVVDPGGSSLQVEEVRAWASGDDAWFFASATLDGPKSGLWSKVVPIAWPPNAVWYVDVQYKTKGLLPDRFSISSRPVVPPGLVPKIRAIDSCL